MVDPQPVRRRIVGGSGPARPTAFLPRAAAKAEDKPMKRSGISTLCGAIVLCTISTAAMAAADSRRGVGHAASGPMFDLPAGMNVSQQERSEEHTSELQSLMRHSYAVFCLKKKHTTRKI